MQQDLLLSILDAVESAGTALALPTQANISYPTRTETENTSGGASPRTGTASANAEIRAQ
jgi:hypothetical protein